LHVYIDGDDPVLFAERLSAALKRRRYADSLLKYNFFVESMPLDRSRRMGREDTARVSSLARAGVWDSQSEFADSLELKLQALLEEAQKDYASCQNLITFEKVMKQGGLGVIMSDLCMPPTPPPPEVPYIAVKQIPRGLGPPDPQVPRDFRQAFEWYCRDSLHIRPEVVGALQLARGMCLDVLTERVFDTNFFTPMKLQEFTERQEVATTRLRGRLTMWVNSIRMHITQRLNQATVKWFNFNETSLEAYHSSRLRPLLVAARLMMSNTFLLLAEDNLAAITEAVEGLVPRRLDFPEDVHDMKNILNVVADPKAPDGERNLEPLLKKTLFRLELQALEEPPAGTAQPPPEVPPDKAAEKAAKAKLQRANSKTRRSMSKDSNSSQKLAEDLQKLKQYPRFDYNAELKDFTKAVIHAFDRGVGTFHDVHSIESVLLPHLIRDDRFDPGFSAESPWLTALRDRCKRACQVHKPWLDTLREKIGEFNDVLVLSPAAEVNKLMEGGDAPPPADVRRQIDTRLARQKEVLDGLPDDPVPVGFFQVDMSALRGQLSQKLEHASQLLLQFLADQLEESVAAATNSFGDIQAKLETKVSNIEEVSEMRDFLKSIPQELGKLQPGIDDAMSLTELVEELRFVLPQETLDNRWKMFGAPGDVKRKAQRVEEYLDKQFNEYLQEQIGDQEGFEKRLRLLEEQVRASASTMTLPRCMRWRRRPRPSIRRSRSARIL
jgi:dynein heavy chain